MAGPARSASSRRRADHPSDRDRPPPELLVAFAHEHFDAELRLTDERTRGLLADLLARFDRWIAREHAAR
jgi:hypothetical protein